MRLCTGHCMLEDLLQVCPNDVLRKMKGEMEESGYTFSKPVCKEEQRSSDCLSVQTALYSPIHSSPREWNNIRGRDGGQERI